MADFWVTLIQVLISIFGIIILGASLVTPIALVAGKAMAFDSEVGFAAWSWLKVALVSLGFIVLIAIEVTIGTKVMFLQDDASLHCGPGTTYHFRDHNEWTCELS